MNYPEYIQTSPYLLKKPTDKSVDEYYYSLLSDELIEIDAKLLEVMKYCIRPVSIDSVLRQFEENIVQDALHRLYVIDSNVLWKMTNVKMMDIEITTHCNYHCKFCPESIHAKPRDSMSMELFEEILEKAERHQSLKYVTFNFFNEPTLDPLFCERVKYLAKTNLKLILHTNGSQLDEDKIRVLKDSGVVDIVQINLPSLDSNEYKGFTGSPTLEKTLDHIENLIRSGLRTGIIVNGTKEEIDRNLPEIKKRYDNKVNIIGAVVTTDKAGYIKNEYKMNVNIKSKLCGCRQVIQNVYLGVHGELMLCCNDYDKNIILGNIKDGELSEILESKKACYIRRKIFGAEDSNEDFICRRCWDMKVNQMYRGLTRKQFSF